MATIESVKFICGITGRRRTVKRVTITQEEYDEGLAAGKRRTVESKERKLSNRGVGGGGKGLYFPGEDEKGGVGEKVASIVTGREWTALNGFKYQDLRGCEVKTVMRPGGRLKVYAKADPMVPYILVTPTEDPLVWVVQGWLYAEEVIKLGSKEDPFGAGSPAYFIEQYELRDMDELPG